MAVDSFIPEVWAAALETTLDKSLVLAEKGVTVNTKYEGAFSQAGDTVHITRLASPTIGDYVKNVTVIDPAVLSTTDETLTITESPFFAFEIDDVDRRQVLNGGALMTEASRLTAQRLFERADTFVATKMVAGAGTKLAAQTINPATTPGAAFGVVVKLKLALDKANVPAAGRFLACSPDFYSALITDPRFINADQYGASGVISNGEVGKVFGFAVKVSTAMPAGTTVANATSNMVIAGTAEATTWASQIDKVEAYRPQNSFSDAVKGLQLYGAKVIRPEQLATADVAVTN